MNFTRNQRELKNNKTPVRVIGLTGGIASGKSVATAALKAAGYAVIDADEISRALFSAGTDGEQSIICAFPQAAENGRLDRAALRKIIATDAEARIRLNELTHPAILTEIKKQIAAVSPPVILSAPLLFETSLSALCDVTVCVYCPRSVRVQRLTARDGMTEEQADVMIDAQIPDTERCTISDYIVPNGSDQAEFISEITELIGEIVRQ